MKHILKSAKTYTCECPLPECECLFAFTYSDLDSVYKRGNGNKEYTIKCPACQSSITLTKLEEIPTEATANEQQ